MSVNTNCEFNLEAPRDDFYIDIDNDENEDQEQQLSNLSNVKNNICDENSSPDKWYHGILDREDAKLRLEERKEPCSYLIRESVQAHGKSNTSYSLSYLSMNNGVTHFRITPICGDYYIGGRKFESLPLLIAYYSTYGSLVKNERLKTPIPPPVPVHFEHRIIAKFPYEGTADTDELTFNAGDVFSVHNIVDDDWLWAIAQKDNSSGLVPKALIEKVDASADPYEGQSWFCSVTKQEAQTILMNYGEVGNFLIRPSDNPGDYSISLRVQNQVSRFLIKREDDHFFLGGRQFSSIEDIISRYNTEQLAEGVSLGEPLPRERYESFYLNLKHCNLNDATDNAEISKAPIVAPSRVISHMKDASQVTKCGYLMKRSGGNRNKWTKCFFVLKGEEKQLLYFENEKRTKPKGFFDLRYTTVYHVHESFFGRPNCFQVVIRAYNEKQTTFLCCESSDYKQEWFDAISRFCTKMCQSKQSPEGVKELRTLELSILHAQKIPVNKLQHPYCLVLLNDVKICRTKCKEPPEPVFEEEFVFDDLPLDTSTFTVALYNHKGGPYKDKEVSRVSINLSTLEPSKTLDQWYTFGSHQGKCEMGSIRLAATYVHEIIMPVSVYEKLQDIILDKDYQVVRSLGEVLKPRDLISLAYTLLRIFRQNGDEINMIISIATRELNYKEKRETLFRGNTLATKLMDQYMKMTAISYLQKTIKEVILKIMECKQCCELDPSRVEKGSNVAENLHQLYRFLEEITSSIFNSAHSCPRSLRYLFYCLRREAKRIWPDEPYIDSRVVSAFLFLRLIVPAVINPKSHNLVNETPSQIASRTLTLVAMCLQKLANLVEFGAKEPYLVIVNPFLQKYRAKMVDFIEEIASQPDPVNNMEINKQDLARDLASIHEIFIKYEHPLSGLNPKTYPKVKFLIPIVEGIKRQKEQYMKQSGTNCDEFAI